MDRQELSQIYHITLEIKRYEDKIRELEQKGRSPQYSGVFSRGGRISDPTGDIALKLAEYRDFVKERHFVLLERKNAAEAWIAEIADAQTRFCMQRRFIDGMQWGSIAKAMGSCSPSMPKMIVQRFFEGKKC